jgi:hypothetical protein
MKKLLLLFVLLSNLSFAQNCVFVDTVTVTAKLRELGNRDIRFGIKQIAEDYLSERYCISENGMPVKIEIFYFGIPKTTLRIVGVEKTNTYTQVGVRLHYMGAKYDGFGESETEVRAVLIEVQEGTIPFEKMTVSSALKKAIHEAIIKLP